MSKNKENNKNSNIPIFGIPLQTIKTQTDKVGFTPQQILLMEQQRKMLSEEGIQKAKDEFRLKDPIGYNLALQLYALHKSPTSEIVYYEDNKGNLKSSLTNAGAMSGNDPIASDVVLGIALNKPILYVGNIFISKLLPSIMGYRKIYHGSKFDFPIDEGIPYSRNNIGLHVTPNKKMALKFGNVKEGYIPRKHDMETIDIWYNNYNWLNDEYLFSARPKTLFSTYDIVLPDTKRISLLQKYGAKPSINYRPSMTNQPLLNTEKDVVLPLRRESLKLSKDFNDKADDIIKRANTFEFGIDQTEKAIQLNKEATELLKNNGIKIIKYWNNNPYEGGGGVAYAITDPKIIKQFNYKINNYVGTSLGTMFGFLNREK